MYMHFAINLQRMAMHRIALSFWGTDEVKTKMKEYFCKNKKVKSVAEWLNLTKYVISLAKEYGSKLPAKMFGELICIVRDVGLRLYGWFRYLQKSSMMSIRSQSDLYNHYFKDKVVWTHYGTIDEIKILEKWGMSPGIPLVRVYNMACLFCLQDEIEEIWRGISKRVKKQLYLSSKSRRNLFRNGGVQLLCYWNAHLKYLKTDVVWAVKNYFFI